MSRNEMKELNEDFFKNLSLKIDDLIDDEQLSIGKVYHPFVVPKAYFETLRAAILSKIDSSVSAKYESPFSSIFRNKKWYSVAASFLVAGTLAALVYTYNLKSQDDNLAINDLSKEDIVAYLDTQPIHFSEISENTNLSENEVTDIESASFLNEDLIVDDLVNSELLLKEIENL